MAAFSQAPPPPFHSAVVPAHDAGAPAAVKRLAIRTFTVWYANGDFVIEGYVDPREASRDEGPNRRPATRPKRRQTAIDWRTLAGQSIAVGPCGPGEHSSKLIRSRRPRQARRSTGLARDIRQLPERFTLEAKGERLLIPPAIST